MVPTDKDIFNILLDLGCCYRCAVRYLHDSFATYGSINTFVENKGLCDTKSQPNGEGANMETTDTQSEESNDSTDSAGPPNVKRAKLNPCVICLDLLQDKFLSEVVSRVSDHEVDRYDSPSFLCSISAPTAVLIREHCMRVHLKNTYPEYYDNELQEVPLNKVWRWSIKDRMASKLNKHFENFKADLSIHIITEYSENDQESMFIKKLTGKKKLSDVNSRKFVSSFLPTIPMETLTKVTQVPPDVPRRGLEFKSVEFRCNSIYIAGRYCKYSRELCQSPWIIDGVKTMETSVEEIIFNKIDQILHVPPKNLKFSSSGREDVDVRCLGRGRPFYIELMDPKFTKFTPDDFARLEDAINKETDLIRVNDLQIVPKEDLVKIKEGEQLKTKTYKTVCQVDGTVNQNMIDKINNQEKLVVDQKTPIRVLHRRPCAVRKKTIYSMKANMVPDKPNLFEMEILTEAGTYVKEFIHGDFNRTKPNLRDIVGVPTDIVALDVISVNLDWPPQIDR